MRASLHRYGVCAVIMSALMFAGCKMGPDYVRPPVASPSGFRVAQSTIATTRSSTPPASRPASTQPATTQPVASLGDVPWWEAFQDPMLKDLLDQAVRNNNDVLVATARVEQARALEQQAQAPFYPQVTYNGNIGTGQNFLFGSSFVNNGKTSGSALATVNAAWELDVWGRIRRQTEAAHAQFIASEDAKQFVLLVLVGDVAQSYFELLGLDEQLQVSKRNTASFEDTLQLFETREQAKVASRLEVTRAQGAMRGAAATIPDTERLIALKENQISILLGVSPRDIRRGPTLLQQVIPPEVPTGLPSALLQRRPDIRLVEQQLRASNALIGVADANFFPQISLTGLLGRASPSVSSFTDGQWNTLGIAAGLVGPIFQGGLLIAQRDQAIAKRAEIAATYQQSAITAFREVSDALTNRLKFAEQVAQRKAQVIALREATDLATTRYVEGRASYFEVLQAKQDLFPAESELANTRTSELVAYVQLYRALGGGWTLPKPPPPTTQPAPAAR